MKYILNHCLLCFQVRELVCCPRIKDGSIGRLKESLVQDFMRLILLVKHLKSLTTRLLLCYQLSF